MFLLIYSLKYLTNSQDDKNTQSQVPDKPFSLKGNPKLAACRGIQAYKLTGLQHFFCQLYYAFPCTLFLWAAREAFKWKPLYRPKRENTEHQVTFLKQFQYVQPFFSSYVCSAKNHPVSAMLKNFHQATFLHQPWALKSSLSIGLNS